MPFTKAICWLRENLSNRSRNEVIPIERNVRPKQTNQECHEETTTDIFSDFVLENDLQLVKRWVAMDANIPSVAACGIIGNLGPFDEETGDEIEMLPMASRPVGPVQNRTQAQIGSLNAIDGSLGQFEQELPEILTVTPTDVTRSVAGIFPVVIAKTAITKVRHRNKPSSYIHNYITLMYIFGTSAFWTMEPAVLKGQKKCIDWIITKLQLILFSVLVALSAFHSFCQAKYSILWFLFKGGFNRFVKFSYNVTCLATSVLGAYTLCHKWNPVKKMVKVISSYEQTWTNANKRTAVCVPFAIVTVTFAFLNSAEILDLDDFTIEDAMLEFSTEMGEDLFIWSSSNLNETVAQIDEDFGTDMNCITVTLAVVRIIRDFSYYMQHGMLWDLIGSVVVTLYCWMSFFMSFVSEVVENVLDETSEERHALQRKREIAWKMYRQIRNVFEAVNDVFGPLLMLFHVKNVLRYAFFMEHCIYPGNITGFTYFNLLLNILKSEIIYIIASNIAKKNMEVRKYLRNWGSQTGKIDVGYTEIDLTAVLDELDMEPLGLGQGNFVIHQGFHFGLLGLVSSLFVMLASKKP